MNLSSGAGIYAPLIAIITGIIIFFGIRTLAYLLSSMFLGMGIGIAFYDLTGIDILHKIAVVLAYLPLYIKYLSNDNYHNQNDIYSIFIIIWFPIFINLI